MSLTSMRGVRSALMAAALASGLAAGSIASAATMDISYFTRDQASQAQSALAAFQTGAASAIGANKRVASVRSEHFEGYEAWDGASGTANPKTGVGSFSSLGGKGYGGSSVNGGKKLQVRSDDPWVWGRYNTSGVDGNWLDSNDTLGMRWDIEGVGKFNSVAFLLTDVADVGAKFTIKAGDTLFSQTIGAAGRMANGSIQLVRILLPHTVTQLSIELRNNRLNDGFGIDGATVARIAPVPVPPAALLLVSGVAGLVGFGRRRRRAAA